MTDLKATPSRLALLRHVDDGAVTERYGIFPTPDRSVLDLGPAAGPDRRKIVNAAVRLLGKAGWVRLGDRIQEAYKAPRLWEITDAGRAVLAAHPEETTGG